MNIADDGETVSDDYFNVTKGRQYSSLSVKTYYSVLYAQLTNMTASPPLSLRIFSWRHLSNANDLDMNR